MRRERHLSDESKGDKSVRHRSPSLCLESYITIHFSQNILLVPLLKSSG
jgi:hypothetical protein